MDAAPAAKRNLYRAWRRIVTRTGIEIFGMDTSLRCAGVAFFAFLSLFPALGSVVLLVGLVVDSSFLIQAIERLSDLLPTSILNLIRDQMLALTNQPNEQLGIGLAAAIALALWSGSRGVNALLYAVSRTRHEADKRSFLLGVAVSLVVTVLGAASLVIALTLVAILPAILSLPFVGLGDSLLLLLRWPVLFGLAVLGFTGFYRFAPDRRPRRFRHVLPGAIVAALLWLAACFLFSFYVEHFGNYDATFGSLSVAVVLLLWMYNSALILVLGASLNAEIEKEWHPSQVRA